MSEETITVDITTMSDGKAKVEVVINTRGENASIDADALADRAVQAYIKAIEKIRPASQTDAGGQA